MGLFGRPDPDRQPRMFGAKAPSRGDTTTCARRSCSKALTYNGREWKDARGFTTCPNGARHDAGPRWRS